MTNTNPGGTPAEPRNEAIEEVDRLWEQVEEGLTDYLSTMVDPDEADHLLIELPGPNDDTGCTPYAQFAAFGGGRMIRAEVSGNGYLMPQYQLDEAGCEFFTMMGWNGNDDAEKNWHIEHPVNGADEIANHVVWAMRYYFGIAHPQLLTHQAWGPASQGVGVLGLCATEDVPTDEPQAPERTLRGHESVMNCLALKPVDRDDLCHIVESFLREKYEGEPSVDDDGDFVLHHMGQPFWIRIRIDQPAVEILARVAHGVHSRRATAVELGLLNRDNLWVNWTLRDRMVWQTLVLPGFPFVPSHLDSMLDLFVETMTATRDDLAYRVGAKVA